MNAGLQINGRGTTGWYGTPKKSYNLKLDNKESICGMPKSKKWALRDNHHDRALLRDRYVSYITHQVFNNMGWQPSNINCDFVLNGEYKGCYVLTERISLENGRLTIPDISKVDDISMGGFLCEIDERYDEKFHFRTKHGFNTYSGNTGVAICLKDPDVVTNEVFDYVQTIVQTAEDALFSENFRDPDKGYAYYFDVDALIDWYLVHEFVCMFDAADFYTSAYFFYNPDDRKIYMGPCWDFDTALRSDPHGLNLKKINSWFNRLFEDERFVALVKSRWNEKKHELKESVKVIDEMANIIRISAEYNFMKWPILGTHYDGLDSWEGLKTYQDQVEFMKGWINDRILYMDEDVNL